MANGQFGGGDGSVNNPRDYLLEFRVGTIDCLALGDIDVTDQAIRLIKGETEYIIPTQVVYAETASLTGVFFAPIDDSLYVTYIESLQFEPGGPYGYYYIDGENLGGLIDHKVPETGDNSITFVISSVSLDDLWRDKSLLDSAYIKAFGVRFLNPPIDEEKPFEFKVKSSLSVKAEITWNILNGDVIYIVDPATLARRLPIKNVINPLISEQINAHYTFTFDTVYDDITKYINNGNIIEVDDDYFYVKRIVKKRSTTISMSVDCEHVSYMLLDNEKLPMPFTEMGGRLFEIMFMLLENTPFSVGDVDFYDFDDFYNVKFKSDTIRGALIELANIGGGELVWNKFTVSLVVERGQNNGLEFSLGENLIGVTEEIDTTGDELRHALEVDVLDLARVPGYEYLKTVDLGDTVRTYDPELEIDETLRIVSRDYNPFQKINPRVNIGNIVRDISDYVKDELVDSSSKDKSDGLIKYGRVIDYDFDWDENDREVLLCQLDDGEWYKCLTSIYLPYGVNITGRRVMVVDGVIIGYFDVIRNDEL